MLNEILLPDDLSIRIARSDDQLFAASVFRSTREHFFLLQPPFSTMPKTQLDLLLTQQFILQQASYKTRFPNAMTYIIEKNLAPIGKIILNTMDGVFHIIDFAFMREVQGVGYGTSVLRAIQAAAAQRYGSVMLSVDQQNLRAKNWYLHSGFSVIESSATHDTMIWRAGDLTSR